MNIFSSTHSADTVVSEMEGGVLPVHANSGLNRHNGSQKSPSRSSSAGRFVQFGIKCMIWMRIS